MKELGKIYETTCWWISRQSASNEWTNVSDAHTGDKWELYNIVNDPAQNNNVADQNPAPLQKMISAYQNYSKNVGIVIPRGALFAFQAKHITQLLTNLRQFKWASFYQNNLQLQNH